jgi:hypothetical protein
MLRKLLAPSNNKIDIPYTFTMEFPFVSENKEVENGNTQYFKRYEYLSVV